MSDLQNDVGIAQATPVSRRAMLRRSVATLGAAGVTAALSPNVVAAGEHPLHPKTPHFAPKAKRVIMFFMNGGASHVDTFDPKPMLEKDHGKKITRSRKLLKSPWKFKRYGQSGLEVTDLFPHVGSLADDLAVIRSVHNDHGDHFEATLGMHTGSNGSAMPGIGAWLSFGLGTDNPNLPSHVVFAAKNPYAGSQVWDSNFLPAYHQGVRIKPGGSPIPNLTPYVKSEKLRCMERGFFAKLNEKHAAARENDQQLRDRMLSFRTATGLQSQAPEAFDIDKESQATLDLYGIGKGDNKSFGWQCLMARRLAERGVRFVEVIDANNWDAHGNIKSHEPLSKNVDKPIAGLIKDLKSRGMLDDTLVVWCTEFGRTPAAPGGGRDHHKYCFTCWLAGGGSKGGVAYGKTDEYGLEIAENGVHVHDFHATILHLLGIDHEQLTFHYGGRDLRLTDLYGNVVQGVIA